MIIQDHEKSKAVIFGCHLTHECGKASLVHSAKQKL